MEPSQLLLPKDGHPILMIGTTKGAFLLSSDASRARWRVSGPHLAGHVVYAAAYDSRQGRRRIWLSSTPSRK